MPAVCRRAPARILLIALVLFAADRFSARADTGAESSAPPTAEPAATPPAYSDGIRPDHLWSIGYLNLLWNDTGSVLTEPARWDQQDWADAGFSLAGIGAAASVDRYVKDHVQAQRSPAEDRFFKQYENLGSIWSFGVIGAFDVWGEVDGDSKAKDTAMDALTASIIGPGIIGTSVKYAVGRVRPNSATRTFDFKPFGGSQSSPSGHEAQAFAVATAIAEHYHAWWVQALCYGGAGLVGYARIEQNAHFTSDVVAGALLGWSVARAVVHRHNGPPNPGKLSWAPYVTGDGAGLVCFKSF